MLPVSHSFMTDIDAAFVQQIFNIAKRQRKTNVQYHRQSNTLTARFEIAKWIRFGHSARLQIRPARLKPVLSDRAVGTVSRARPPKVSVQKTSLQPAA